MRLFRLTFATIFRRKAWAICLFAVLVLPFALPMISSATEMPVLMQPARIQAAWAALYACTMLWGFFAAANLGESNTKSGAGEYFRTTGLSATRQLFEIWLAVFSYIAPLAVIATCICLFAAMPGDPNETTMWWTLNLQYLALFLLVFAPLLAMATALASRFGGIIGYGVTLFVAIYGLYGVSYLDNMLKLEQNSVLQGLWLYSPHYRLADLTQRLYFKAGALSGEAFTGMLLYFTAILAVNTGLSRLCFRSCARA